MIATSPVRMASAIRTGGLRHDDLELHLGALRA